MDNDFALAVALQEQLYEEEGSKIQVPSVRTDISIVDNYWELADPSPNIHELFLQFDATYFKSALNNAGVEVRWSPRMTLCAGVCSYEGRGGLCSVRLSRPLLKYRPRRDLVQTLLHEMIHAYLFVAERNTDHDAHGPQFLFHMERINKLSGAKITVYHTFHDEVNEYRQHWWKCNGPCQHKPPYYGVVKRAMNRPPSNKDSWWSKHQETCGGTYIKIKEPDDYKKKGKTKEEESLKTPQGKNTDIKKLLEKQSSNTDNSTSKQSFEKTEAGFSGSGHTLGGMKQGNLSKQFSRPSEAAAFAAQKRHSQTNTSPAKKRMKESSKGKELYKENTKVVSSSVKEIGTVNKSPSKTSASQDIRDLFSKGVKCSKKTGHSITDGVPCSSSTFTAQEDKDDIIDLTNDTACPICGFTSLNADMLSTHINECLVQFSTKQDSEFL